MFEEMNKTIHYAVCRINAGGLPSGRFACQQYCPPFSNSLDLAVRHGFEGKGCTPTIMSRPSSTKWQYSFQHQFDIPASLPCPQLLRPYVIFYSKSQSLSAGSLTKHESYKLDEFSRSFDRPPWRLVAIASSSVEVTILSHDVKAKVGNQNPMKIRNLNCDQQNFSNPLELNE